MTAAAIVLGAGRGVRLGEPLPKAEVRVAGRALLDWSACALGRAQGIGAVQPVVALPAAGDDGSGTSGVMAEIEAGWEGPADLLPATPGGATRQESVARGLAALLKAGRTEEYVVVHDAARCLLLPGDVEAVLAAARPTGAAVLVAPLEDTVKEVEGNRILGTPDRSRLVRALTPQAFRCEILRRAHERAREAGFTGTDCASLVERLGIEVRICPCSGESFKVTTPLDLERASRVLRRREGVL